MKFLGFVGPKGSGKDTAADILIKAKKAKGKLSFARPLKEICSKVFDIPMQVLNDPELKEKPFAEMKQFGEPVVLTSRALRLIKRECSMRVPETDDNVVMKYNVERASITGLEGRAMKTPRQLLQVIGTDFIRDRIYKNWHLEAAFSEAQLSKLTKSGVYCITDARFPNELEFLKEKFGAAFTAYYVERPEAEERLAAATHESELGVKAIREVLGEEHVIQNAGTMDAFGKLVKGLKAPEESTAEKTKGPGSKFIYGPRE